MVSRTNKFRGSRTHGRGRKSGRGAGIHGGRGNAGLHKHKYMHTLKYDPLHFGVHGFKRPQKMVRRERAITVASLQDTLQYFALSGHARQEREAFTVDLSAAGYGRLLAGGKARVPMHITVGRATERARKSVEAAGGTVTLK